MLECLLAQRVSYTPFAKHEMTDAYCVHIDISRLKTIAQTGNAIFKNNMILSKMVQKLTSAVYKLVYRVGPPDAIAC